MQVLQHQAESPILQVGAEPPLQLQELLESQKKQQCKRWSTGLEMSAEEKFSCSAPELAFPSTDLPRAGGDLDAAVFPHGHRCSLPQPHRKGQLVHRLHAGMPQPTSSARWRISDQ